MREIKEYGGYNYWHDSFYQKWIAVKEGAQELRSLTQEELRKKIDRIRRRENENN